MLSSVEQAFVGREEIRAPLKTPAWEARVCLGVFWDFIGKYNFIKDVGKLMSYIGNAHPSVGKYYGKILGLVWDFYVSKILISCLPACRRLLFPLLHVPFPRATKEIGDVRTQANFMLGIQHKKLGMFIPIL